MCARTSPLYHTHTHTLKLIITIAIHKIQIAVKRNRHKRTKKNQNHKHREENNDDYYKFAWVFSVRSGFSFAVSRRFGLLFSTPITRFQRRPCCHLHVIVPSQTMANYSISYTKQCKHVCDVFVSFALLPWGEGEGEECEAGDGKDGASE